MDVSFLHIEGIRGESVYAGFAGQIELTSFSYGCSQPATPVCGHGASGTGRPMHYMLKFTKTPDIATPSICSYVWTGDTVPRAALTACRMNNGKPVPFMQISLEDVIVAEYNLVNSEGGTKEIVSLNFGKIRFEYINQDGKDPLAIIHDLKENEITRLS